MLMMHVTETTGDIHGSQTTSLKIWSKYSMCFAKTLTKFTLFDNYQPLVKSSSLL